MKWEWATYVSYFPPEICKLILESGMQIPAQPAKVGIKSGIGVNEEIRRSQVRFIQNDMKWRWLFDCLWKLATETNDKFGFDITKLGFMQLAEYKAADAGEYRRHQDVFWVTDAPLHRKLSCVIQLSDPATYAGGDLELYHVPTLKTEDVRKQGTVIFFPSFTFHAALPITQGIRYSLAAWLEGPKWR